MQGQGVAISGCSFWRWRTRWLVEAQVELEVGVLATEVQRA